MSYSMIGSPCLYLGKEATIIDQSLFGARFLIEQSTAFGMATLWVNVSDLSPLIPQNSARAEFVARLQSRYQRAAALEDRIDSLKARGEKEDAANLASVFDAALADVWRAFAALVDDDPEFWGRLK